MIYEDLGEADSEESDVVERAYDAPDAAVEIYDLIVGAAWMHDIARQISRSLEDDPKQNAAMVHQQATFLLEQCEIFDRDSGRKAPELALSCGFKSPAMPILVHTSVFL